MLKEGMKAKAVVTRENVKAAVAANAEAQATEAAKAAKARGSGDPAGPAFRPLRVPVAPRATVAVHVVHALMVEPVHSLVFLYVPDLLEVRHEARHFIVVEEGRWLARGCPCLLGRGFVLGPSFPHLLLLLRLAGPHMRPRRSLWW